MALQQSVAQIGKQSLYCRVSVQLTAQHQCLGQSLFLYTVQYILYAFLSAMTICVDQSFLNNNYLIHILNYHQVPVYILSISLFAMYLHIPTPYFMVQYLGHAVTQPDHTCPDLSHVLTVTKMIITEVYTCLHYCLQACFASLLTWHHQFFILICATNLLSLSMASFRNNIPVRIQKLFFIRKNLLWYFFKSDHSMPCSFQLLAMEALEEYL